MARRRYTQAWQYEIAGEKYGPVDEEQMTGLISDGTVTMMTPVWRQGLESWQPASETELRNQFDGSGTPNPETILQAKEIAARPRKQAPLPGETKPIDGFLKWLRISLILFMVATAASILAALNLLSFFGKVEASGFANEAASLAAGTRVDQIRYLALATYLLTFLSCTFAYGFFFQRAANNLKALHSPIMTAKSFATWAWYLVPIANLWKPLDSFGQVRDGSAQMAGHRITPSGTVGLWWGVWIIANIVTNIGNRVSSSADGIPGYTAAAYLEIASNGLLIVAAFLLLRIVTEIGQHHNEARLAGEMSVFS